MEETDLNASMIESSTGTESSHGTEPSKEAESSINEDDEPIIVGKGRNIIRSKTKSFSSGNNEPIVLGNASSK